MDLTIESPFNTKRPWRGKNKKYKKYEKNEKNKKKNFIQETSK